jgi:hypothetical protein
MLKNNLDKLKADYKAAMCAFDAVEKNVRGKSGWPEYPIVMEEFMCSLSKPPWVKYDYQPDRWREIEANIQQASLEDIRRLLTLYSRAERFGDGAWEIVFMENRLDPLIKRLEELASEES